MNHIFEYGSWVPVKRKDELKALLKNIWEKRLFTFEEFELKDNNSESNYQPFLHFDGENIRANNFIGFIQNKDELIEIYPKVLRGEKCSDKRLMLQHIFYWFSYCRKWRFPFNQANVDTRDIDKFPELITHLIANQIFETVSSQPLMQYQQVEETFSVPRGSISFGRYINNSLSKGNYHKIECDYEPFLFDNKVNRIIKYCARILFDQTRFSENIYLLQKSLNILDEVEDIACSVSDINSISLTSFYQEYILLMDVCRMVISQQLYSHESYHLSQWCLLFPMEYIFEDFIAGFLERNFSLNWKIEYQRSDMYLSNYPSVFQMQHDIFLTNRKDENKKVIVDTKYKVRKSGFKEDPKKGVSQTDIYQMLSYALRRGCSDVLIVYPNIGKDIYPKDAFKVQSGFPGKEEINITAAEVPFWSIENLDSISNKLYATLSDLLKMYE